MNIIRGTSVKKKVCIPVSLEIFSFSSFSKTKEILLPISSLWVTLFSPNSSWNLHHTSLSALLQKSFLSHSAKSNAHTPKIPPLVPQAQKPGSLHTSCGHPSCSATFPFPEALLAHLKSPIRNPSSSTSQLFLPQDPFGKGGGRG